MSERIAPTPVEAVKDWIEKDIVGQGICPPLVRLTRQYLDGDHTIDWKNLSQEVVITDLTSYRPDDTKLLPVVAESYMTFIYDAMRGEGPLSWNAIVPDFGNNKALDEFTNDVKLTALDTFTLIKEGRSFARQSLRSLALMQGCPPEQLSQLMRQDPVEIATQLIEQGFNIINFYGRQVSDSDVSDFSDVRGPVARYKMLARAPYDLLQVNNTVRSDNLVANLNKRGLEARNTRIALGTDLVDLESRMRAFRK